ncbi:MAG TPA: glycosyltransferase family 39 protein [Spongiibacteraceae bacterium]
MRRWALRHPRWTIVALAALIFGSALGQRYPWHIDEVRFVGVALEMLQSGQWWVPHRAGEIYADKPPIFFWALGALFKLTGSVRWSFLLPAMLSGIATLLLVYDLAARLWNRRTGLCAAILLLACYQFWRLATYAHIDGFLLLWTTLGLYGFVRHLLSGRDIVWFYGGFVAIAIGILSKGVGFLPLLIFIPYAVLRKRAALPSALSTRQWLSGIALLLGLLLCWLLPLVALAHSDPEIKNYLNEILFHQTANRYTKAWQHREPVWFFLQEIPKYWAPLSILLPWIAPLWWRRLRRLDPRYVLLLGWAALVLLFFSLSSGKRELYMLPALPAVAIAAAPAVLLLLRQRWLQRVTVGASCLLIVSIAGAGIIRLRNALPQSPLADWPPNTAYVLLAAALAAMIIFILLRRQSPALRWLAVYAVIIIFYNRGLLPLTDDRESGRAAMAVLSERAPNGLALIDWDEREWLFARTTILHNGIRSKPELNICSLAAPATQWLLPLEMARRAALPLESAISVQPNDVFVVATAPIAASHCFAADAFRFQFQWSDTSLQRLDR